MALFRNALAISVMLLLADSLLTALIIWRVPYTKIDWDAYMSQVNGYLEGERNYTNLGGDTGPLVYPAGFLYFYAAVQYVTGGAVFPAQVMFGLLYILNVGIVLAIYNRTRLLPPWAFCLLCLSKRVHSIFALRLFNDCVATTLAHLAILLFQSNKWKSGLVVFSFGVSVKMSVLLYAPPLLLLMMQGSSLLEVALAISLAALVQILIGIPFLLSYPLEYVSRAFDLGRIFIHFWSVNFKFIREDIFLSKKLALVLLLVHLSMLFLFAQHKWCKHEGGVVRAMKLNLKLQQLRHSLSSIPLKLLLKEDSTQQLLEPEYVTTVLFTGNFIGILCARSLHYQFYSWYFYTLPHLLWKCPFPTLSRCPAIFEGLKSVTTQCYQIHQVSCHLLQYMPSYKFDFDGATFSTSSLGSKRGCVREPLWQGHGSKRSIKLTIMLDCGI